MGGLNPIIIYKGAIMPFDEDPQEDIEYYPCNYKTCDGVVTFNNEINRWECDTCDFSAETNSE